MPTPRQGYRLADGTKVPGVTTVISQLGWNKNQLLWWAWSEGQAGRDFRDTSGKATRTWPTDGRVRYARNR